MKKLMVLGVAMVLMLVSLVLAEEPIEKLCEHKYLELDVKYQQSLAEQAELNIRLIQMQRYRLTNEDGVASLNQREIKAVQDKTREPIAQSQRALQDYLKSLEPRDEKTDNSDPGM